MSTERNPFTAWRKDAVALVQRGRRLERAARATGLPLEPRPTWGTASLDWCELHGSLEDFSARVKRVAEQLGPPVSVQAKHWGGAFDENAPDLVARWTLTDAIGPIEVTVRTMFPTGCKIDPRSKFVPQQEPKLHPECAAVLRELEEVGHAAE